jgi:uncharacterized membrane protein YphA (DoxX/SURF4 family)
MQVNVVLWIAQVLLALAFLGAGYDQAMNYADARRRLPWIGALPRSVAVAVGGLEIAGAIALVLPGLSGDQRWLTAAAALGLAVMMAAAAAFHIGRNERVQLAFSAAFFVAAAFVAYGRFVVAPL